MCINVYTPVCIIRIYIIQGCYTNAENRAYNFTNLAKTNGVYKIKKC